MKTIVLNRDLEVSAWVAARAGGSWQPGSCTTLGLAENGKLIAGVVYDSWNGASLCMHVAAEPTRRWLTRQFLQISFDYPFNQTKVRVILSPVASGNAACIRFIEHLGFTLGATLKNAHPDGDLLLYTMQREQCRWLNILKDTAHGQSERATAT